MSIIIADMWIFNGETKTEFQPYWDAIVAVLEEQNGAGVTTFFVKKMQRQDSSREATTKQSPS
eukprot:2833333-Ditylum_brightwellii.AAC.1